MTSPIDCELADALDGKVSDGKAVIETGRNFHLPPVSPLGGNLTNFAETQLIKSPNKIIRNMLNRSFTHHLGFYENLKKVILPDFHGSAGCQNFEVPDFSPEYL